MIKKKTRARRPRSEPSGQDSMAFPILFVLVMTVMVLGMFLYTGLLVAGSVIFVSFFAWLWWTRRETARSLSKPEPVARRKRKTRRT